MWMTTCSVTFVTGFVISLTLFNLHMNVFPQATYHKVFIVSMVTTEGISRCSTDSLFKSRKRHMLLTWEGLINMPTEHRPGSLIFMSFFGHFVSSCVPGRQGWFSFAQTRQRTSWWQRYCLTYIHGRTFHDELLYLQGENNRALLCLSLLPLSLTYSVPSVYCMRTHTHTHTAWERESIRFIT